jgi:hypothetical protein
VLAFVLLESDFASTVTLFAKSAPVFVSDALPKDVDAHIDFIARLEGAQRLGGLLREHVNAGRIEVIAHTFFTSPLPFCDSPEELSAAFAEASLVIVKGDANYRRLLGDRHWPYDTPFAEAVGYFPASLLALRTLKSGVAVGVTKEAEARARQLSRPKEGEWLCTGRFAVAQLAVVGKTL